MLHVRCDAGALLREVLDAYPDARVDGLDYFATNVQAAREWGLDRVELLDPAAIQIPFEQKYDLIVCNHIFTHSLVPGADIETLRNSLAPGGRMFFYNENDHELICTPGNEFFTRKEMISYHKQMLTPDSFARFLASKGLQSELIGHRKFTFTMLAWQAPAAFAAIDAKSLKTRRRTLVKWNSIAEHNRYLIPLAGWARRHGFGGLARALKRRAAGEAKKQKRNRPAEGSDGERASKRESAAI
jgi:SAM-dependent methyltransferase